MRRWTVKFLMLFCLALPASTLADGSEDIIVKSNVSKTSAAMGDRLTYSITIASSKTQIAGEDVRFSQSPEFRRLRLLNKTPSRQIKQMWNNGRMTMMLVLSWHLMAEIEGTAEITGGALEFRGQSYDIDRHTIEVGLPAAASSAVTELNDRKILPPSSDSPQVDKQLTGRVFTALEVEKADPYLQEAFEARCVLYVDSLELARQISNPEWMMPEWDGFYAEKLPKGELRLQPVTVDGKSYQRVTIGRVRLVPTRTGTIKIPMTVATVLLQVQSSRRSFEDRFFDFGFPGLPGLGFDTMRVRLPMVADQVKVRRLPLEGRPPSFQNAVGQFAVAVNVDREEMTEDDFLTLRIEIGGEGFLGSIAPPELPPMPDWSLVADPEEKIRQAGEATTGKKTFEYMLRPQRPGMLEIPEIAYAYFDPDEERYVEEVVGPFHLEVAKGVERRLAVASNNDTAGEGRPGDQVEVGDAPIAYIHAETPASISAPLPFHQSMGFALMMLASPAVFLLGVGVRWWRGYRERHGDQFRRRSAAARVRRELRRVAQVEKSAGSREAAAILANAIRQYLADKYDRSAPGLTLEEVEDLVLMHGTSADDARRLREIVEGCDQAEYLPERAQDVSMKSAAGEALEILEHLDGRKAS
ncbi:MAG: BatD family protein [Candidatus Sumerlaeota bacterium]